MLSALWWTSYHSQSGDKCLIRKFQTSVAASRFEAEYKAGSEATSGFTKEAANVTPLSAIPVDSTGGSSEKSASNERVATPQTANQQSAPDESQNTVTTLVVSPNLSMSWRANLLLVGAIAVVCIGSGLVWAYFGLWMVLPFAGLEVLFVTACLYLTVRKLSVKEVITIGTEEIRLEWGMYEPQRSVTLPRHWSKLDYQCDDNPFEVGSLTVGAHGKHYPLGLGLGRDEKHTLYRELHQLL